MHLRSLLPLPPIWSRDLVCPLMDWHFQSLDCLHRGTEGGGGDHPAQVSFPLPHMPDKAPVWP